VRGYTARNFRKPLITIEPERVRGVEDHVRLAAADED